MFIFSVLMLIFYVLVGLLLIVTSFGLYLFSWVGNGKHILSHAIIAILVTIFGFCIICVSVDNFQQVLQ